MDFIYSIGNSLLIAILSSVISSIFVILILQAFLKPKIKISPVICKKTKEDGRIVYVIKVINVTGVDIFDIQARLHLVSREQTFTGEFTKTSEIKLKRSNPFVISAYGSNRKNYGVFRFLTEEDIEKKWEKDDIQYLRFTILGKHRRSNTLGYFEQEYRTKRSSIKEGVFLVGNTFDIK
ncbi:hypothetical protein [Capnocytophaga canis]|uniref:Uncharacterized protein n=1 Tax=Capnocytophaga canis TaxID=1848903 RepID=A0A0B7IRY8_9FLAO|nr:hypothetical protein [Capnocytophaga canis]CEN52792.1 conserved hypothetical protein [Capnocytophaga canis]